VEQLRRAWAETLADMIASEEGYDLHRISPGSRYERLDQALHYIEVLSSQMYLDLQNEIINRDDYISLLLAERKQNAH